MPVKAMTILYLFAVSITWSSRMEPPGSAMYCTPDLRARSTLSPKGKNASLPQVTPLWVAIQASFLRSQDLGAHLEDLLPLSVSQDIVILVGNVNIDGVVPVRRLMMVDELKAPGPSG